MSVQSNRSAALAALCTAGKSFTNDDRMRLHIEVALRFIESLINNIPSDDPNDIKTLAGYPVKYYVVYISGYILSITFREDYLGPVESKSGEGTFSLSATQDFALEWLERLYYQLMEKFGWLQVYQRYPMVFRNHDEEIQEFLRFESGSFESFIKATWSEPFDTVFPWLMLRWMECSSIKSNPTLEDREVKALEEIHKSLGVEDDLDEEQSQSADRQERDVAFFVPEVGSDNVQVRPGEGLQKEEDRFITLADASRFTGLSEGRISKLGTRELVHTNGIKGRGRRFDIVSLTKYMGRRDKRPGSKPG
jgi:hypothetical protein